MSVVSRLVVIKPGFPARLRCYWEPPSVGVLFTTLCANAHHCFLQDRSSEKSVRSIWHTFNCEDILGANPLAHVFHWVFPSGVSHESHSAWKCETTNSQEEAVHHGVQAPIPEAERRARRDRWSLLLQVQQREVLLRSALLSVLDLASPTIRCCLLDGWHLVEG